MGGGLESRCVGRVCGADGAVHFVPCAITDACDLIVTSQCLNEVN